eukprot:UN02536
MVQRVHQTFRQEETHTTFLLIMTFSCVLHIIELRHFFSSSKYHVDYLMLDYEVCTKMTERKLHLQSLICFLISSMFDALCLQKSFILNFKSFFNTHTATESLGIGILPNQATTLAAEAPM